MQRYYGYLSYVSNTLSVNLVNLPIFHVCLLSCYCHLLQNAADIRSVLSCYNISHMRAFMSKTDIYWTIDSSMSIKYEHDISHSNIVAKCICVRYVKNI